MDKIEVLEFIKTLDVTNVDVEREFYDQDPSDILILNVKPSKIEIETVNNGFLTFKFDCIDVDVKKELLCFISENTAYLEIHFNKIKTARIVHNLEWTRF